METLRGSVTCQRHTARRWSIPNGQGPLSVMLTQAAGQCSLARHDCGVHLPGLSAECTLPVPCRQGEAHRGIRSSKATQSPPHLDVPSFLCTSSSRPDQQEGTPMASTVDEARNPGVVFIRAVSFLLESPRPASPCLSKDLTRMSISFGGAGSPCCQDKGGQDRDHHCEPRGPSRECHEQRSGVWLAPGIWWSHLFPGSPWNRVLSI